MFWFEFPKVLSGCMGAVSRQIRRHKAQRSPMVKELGYPAFLHEALWINKISLHVKHARRTPTGRCRHTRIRSIERSIGKPGFHNKMADLNPRNIKVHLNELLVELSQGRIHIVCDNPDLQSIRMVNLMAWLIATSSRVPRYSKQFLVRRGLTVCEIKLPSPKRSCQTESTFSPHSLRKGVGAADLTHSNNIHTSLIVLRHRLRTEETTFL